MPLINKTDEKGFTLIELLVALALTAILTVTIGYAFRVQIFTHKRQEVVAALQQNLRTAMFFIENDLRSAGADPTNNATDAKGNRAGILEASTGTEDTSGFVQISMNRAKDFSKYNATIGESKNDKSEILRYLVEPNEKTFKVKSVTYKDGIPQGSPQPIAENIIDLKFAYFDKNSAEIATDSTGNIQSENLNDIRRVKVTHIRSNPTRCGGYSKNPHQRRLVPQHGGPLTWHRLSLKRE